MAEEPVWHLHGAGGPSGPHTHEEIRNWLAGAQIGLDDLLWREGWPEWIPVTRVPDFAADIPEWARPLNPPKPAPAAPAPVPAAAVAPDKSLPIQMRLAPTGPVAMERPIQITGVCLLGWFVCAMLTLASFMLLSVSGGAEMAAGMILEALLTSVCLTGIWKMRRWGVLAFLALQILDVGVSLAMGMIPGKIDILLTVMILGIGFKYWEDLD